MEVHIGNCTQERLRGNTEEQRGGANERRAGLEIEDEDQRDESKEMGRRG